MSYTPLPQRSPEVSLEPLVVRPRTAWRMLDCGNAYGYRLLASGELESYRDGRARKITVESIHRYINRKLGKGDTH
jgi:excisionase family DNA binding protein